MNYKSKFEKTGFLPATSILSSTETSELVKNLSDTIKKYDIFNNEYRCKSHMLFKWVGDLVHCSTIIDIVKELIGENIICIDTMFWKKDPKSTNYVSFHQDGYYWNIQEPVKGVTVWIPFQDTDKINGTIQYLKNSHSKFIHHKDLKDDFNLLKRGQSIDISTFSFPIVSCDVKLGQGTFHHPYTIHGSKYNYSDNVRLACNIQYISGDSKTLIDRYKEYGILINGVNNTNITMVNRPGDDFNENYKIWKTAWYNQRQNYLIHTGR